MIKIHETQLFVTSCYSTYLKDIDVNKINESVNKILNKENSVIRSNVNGLQSSSYKRPNYDNIETMRLFEDFIKPICDKIVGEWGIQTKNKEISYWYNVNPQYSYNKEHYHPNSFLSGVFYLKAPPNSGKIVFVRAQSEIDRMTNITSELSTYNVFINNNRINVENWFVPDEKLLLLFPSHITHYVEQNNSNSLEDNPRSVRQSPAECPG